MLYMQIQAYSYTNICFALKELSQETDYLKVTK